MRPMSGLLKMLYRPGTSPALAVDIRGVGIASICTGCFLLPRKLFASTSCTGNPSYGAPAGGFEHFLEGHGAEPLQHLVPPVHRAGDHCGPDAGGSRSAVRAVRARLDVVAVQREEFARVILRRRAVRGDLVQLLGLGVPDDREHFRAETGAVRLLEGDHGHRGDGRVHGVPAVLQDLQARPAPPAVRWWRRRRCGPGFPTASGRPIPHWAACRGPP